MKKRQEIQMQLYKNIFATEQFLYLLTLFDMIETTNSNDLKKSSWGLQSSISFYQVNCELYFPKWSPVKVYLFTKLSFSALINTKCHTGGGVLV